MTTSFNDFVKQMVELSKEFNDPYCMASIECITPHTSNVFKIWSSKLLAFSTASNPDECIAEYRRILEERKPADVTLDSTKEMGMISVDLDPPVPLVDFQDKQSADDLPW